MSRVLRILVTLAACAALAACSRGGGKSSTSTPAAPATSTPGAASPVAATATPGAIRIDRPAAGAAVGVPFEIAGRANVFEAALVVQVLGPNGQALCERHVQATSGTGTPGTWAATMAFVPPPSAGTATIRAFSLSPRDGSEQNVVTRAVLVQADAPAIVIAQPRCNADVAQGSMLNANGTASVFEATLIVELRDAAGTVLVKQVVTADAAGPATGRWSTRLDVSRIVAGTYELVAYSASPRDGAPENIFSIPVRITV